MVRGYSQFHTLLVIVLCVLWTTKSYAYDFKVENEDGQAIYYNVSEEGVNVTYKNLDNNGYSGNVNIPSYVIYNGQSYTVNGVESMAFWNCRTLLSVTLPETIKYIGDYAFYGCNLLTTVVLPPSISSIESNTFENCYNLQSINIPSSVIYIGNQAFYNCRSLEAITLPKSVRVIDGHTFYGCDNIKTVTSLIEKPFTIEDLAFPTKQTATLFVPIGTKGLYEQTKGWDFATIKEIGQVTATIPYAVWCEGNTTLYFFTSNDSIAEGEFYQGQIVTRVWSDTEVTETGEIEPNWRPVVEESLTKVVFDESFKDVLPTSTYQWFLRCTKLEVIDGIENLNTSEVTTMRAMFSTCESLKSLDVSNFNTAKVKTMRNLFAYCSKLKQLDLMHFKTDNVTDMFGMFQRDSCLIYLDLSSFNTENVKDMSIMFDGCVNLTEIDLSSFNTSKVETMESMFYNCMKLSNLDVTNFNTSNVTNMAWMFYGCTSLQQLDLTNFNTQNVKIIRTMFGHCHNLHSLNLNHWDLEAAESVRSMFICCHNLSEIFIDNWKMSHVKDMHLMFEHCLKLRTINLKSAQTKEVERMDSMFINCEDLKSIIVGEGWSTENLISSKDMFYNCTKIIGEKGTTYDSYHVDGSYAHIDEDGNSGYLSTIDTSNHLILTVTCSDGGWVEFNNERITNVTKSFVIENGEDVEIEFGANDGYELAKRSFSASHFSYNTHHCTIYNMNSDAAIEIAFKRTSIPAKYETIDFAESSMRTFCSSNALDFSHVDGLEAYIASGFNTATGDVIMSKVNQVQAYTGLLLVGQSNTAYEVPFTETNTQYSNLLIGVTENTELTYGYVLNMNNGLFEAVEENRTLKGGEAYLNIPIADDRKQIRIQLTDTMSGVNDISGIIYTKNAWYTLQGSRLMNTPKQRGIYIHNGRKMFIK